MFEASHVSYLTRCQDQIPLGLLVGILNWKLSNVVHFWDISDLASPHYGSAVGGFRGMCPWSFPCGRVKSKVLSFVFKVTYLTLVWCSYFCYSASVREPGGSAAVLGLINTITKYILKYSTDVYFIPNTNNINSIYGKNLPFTFVRSHL